MLKIFGLGINQALTMYSFYKKRKKKKQPVMSLEWEGEGDLLVNVCCLPL
jgi:hypothetical protein